VAATAVDTSVIIAGLLAWHEHHENAFRSLTALLDSEDEFILPAPVLMEAYSVMTRLPPPHRLSPRDAFSLLDTSFRQCARIAQLGGRDIWPFLRDAAQDGTAGGQTYDAQILACAAKAGAERMLTLNTRDFERLAPSEIEVVTP